MKPAPPVMSNLHTFFVGSILDRTCTASFTLHSPKEDMLSLSICASQLLDHTEM